MDEKLNIKSLLPMSGLSIKVKALYQQKPDVRDRSFDRHLKKDGNKKKKENEEAKNHYDIGATKQIEESSVDSSMNERICQNDKYKQIIDVLA